MAEQVEKKKQPKRESEKVPDAPKAQEQGKKLKEDMDKLLDDIDDVLEENAEEFVKSYVQRGGE